jgi:hypothetical protein
LLKQYREVVLAVSGAILVRPRLSAGIDLGDGGVSQGLSEARGDHPACLGLATPSLFYTQTFTLIFGHAVLPSTAGCLLSPLGSGGITSMRKLGTWTLCAALVGWFAFRPCNFNAPKADKPAKRKSLLRMARNKCLTRDVQKIAAPKPCVRSQVAG